MKVFNTTSAEATKKTFFTPEAPLIGAVNFLYLKAPPVAAIVTYPITAPVGLSHDILITDPLLLPASTVIDLAPLPKSTFDIPLQSPLL